MWLKKCPTIETIAVASMETRRRNPAANTRTNEKTFCANMPRTPCVRGRTSHILFRASLNSPNTAEAPKARVETAIAVAMMPWAGLLVLAIRLRTVFAPMCPSTAWAEWTILCSTDWVLKTSDMITRRKTTSGARESRV